jgi:phage-related protein
MGGKHDQAKPLRGFGAARVFLLHVFQKKSKFGIATPKPDLDLIRNRLKVAARRAKELENEQTQYH